MIGLIAIRIHGSENIVLRWRENVNREETCTVDRTSRVLVARGSATSA